MAKDESKRLNSETLSQDEEAFNALQKITGYAPANPACAIDALHALFEAMRAAQKAEDQAHAAFVTARDNAAAAEWDIHNLMLSAKDQVKAQFGKDSTQLQEVGLKRASDYKRPGRRSKTDMDKTKTPA